MLRTFLIENDSKQRAIVTEYDLPTTPDWHVVRELLQLQDPIKTADVLHSAVQTFQNMAGLPHPDSPAALMYGAPGRTTTTPSWLKVAAIAGGAYLLFKK